MTSTIDPSSSEPIDALIDRWKSQQQRDADAVPTDINDAVNHLVTTRDIDSFLGVMAAQQQRALSQWVNNVNQAFDQALKLGDEHPALQQQILIRLEPLNTITSSFEGLIRPLFSNVSSMGQRILQDGAGVVAGLLKDYGSAVSKLLANA